MDKDKYFRARLADLADRAEKQDIYMYSGFLGLSEQSELLSAGFPGVLLFGGAKGCERVMARFGDPKRIGYEEPFPIICLEIRKASLGDREEIGHRDVLGALMNLGIKRELLGDIMIREDSIYVFCKDMIADFIRENLFMIKHTSVILRVFEGDMGLVQPGLEPVDIQVPSLRMDALISKAFRLSRNESASLIRSGKAFINGMEIKNDSKTPVEDDIISLRGYGRFRLGSQLKSTKKGNLIIRIYRFV